MLASCGFEQTLHSMGTPGRWRCKVGTSSDVGSKTDPTQRSRYLGTVVSCHFHLRRLRTNGHC
jgi:hypothetical protein